MTLFTVRTLLMGLVFWGLVLLAWLSFGDGGGIHPSKSVNLFLGLSRGGGDSDGPCDADDGDSAQSNIYQRFLSTVSSTAIWPWSSWSLSSWSSSPPSNSSLSSSLLRIDPSRIVSTIAEYGGFLLPASFQQDLKVLQAVCHCESTYLDMATRELQILDFRVDSPSPRAKWPAVQMGQFRVQWDSYLSPCVHVELHNVTVVVEFDNLWLTRSNWNELSEAGFPPPMEALFVSKDTEEEPRQNTAPIESDQDEWVRIGSLSLKGNVRLRLWSRPLEESLLTGDASNEDGSRSTDLILSLESLQGLMERIRVAAAEQEAKVGRRGCTSTQLYEIIQNYFLDQIKQGLYQVASRQLDSDQEGGQHEILAEAARKWTMGVGNAVQDYATRALNKAEDSVIDRVRDSLLLMPDKYKEQLFGAQDLKAAWRSSLPQMKSWLFRQAENLKQRSMAPNEMLLQEDDHQSNADVDACMDSEECRHADSKSRSEESRTKTLQPQEIHFADW